MLFSWFLPPRGHRKWCAFFLLVLVFVLFVMTGKLNDQTLIRDVLLGLMAAFGVANVGSAAVDRMSQRNKPAPVADAARPGPGQPEGNP